ncbi:ISNCY family transposase [Acetonema longum]|uniref:Integrase catalytic region n=1 Tax=Acetonema longum DSM 6540 TaxID=1009370 RepID=F7NN34_9FIRM|nr:ISNCY family transposase [Acetonema longum]EGO62548.1 Integrase catalytic region [Acetonema longum DSM 6540]
MSPEQLNRHSVLRKLIDGDLTLAQAASSLNLSKRQVIRLKKGFIKEGPGILVHKNSGRKPAHAFSEEFVATIISLKQSDLYRHANFLHFQELLLRQEQISISYSALHALLTKAKIQSPKKRRRFKPHRRRKRKLQEGLLIQMDATPFAWFGTEESYALHGAIDDATGKVVGLYLTKHECLMGYWEVIRQMGLQYGIPVSLYTDRHAIFLSTAAGRLSIEDQLAGKLINDTQFSRAMKELGVTIIPARSPQAKGRVERLWETLQSRLPVEFQIAGVSSIDQANEFLIQYIPLLNQRFAVEPGHAVSAFRPLAKEVDLDTVLCVKLTRSVDAGGVFSFYNRHFKVIATPSLPILPPKAKVSVLVSPRSGFVVQYKGTLYQALPYSKPVRQATVPPAAKQKTPWKPPDTHYHKYGHTLVNKVSFEDSDQDIIAMLESIFLSRYAEPAVTFSRDI